MAGSWIENGLDKLTNLRKLGIFGDVRPHHNALSDSIEKLTGKLKDGIVIPPFKSFRHHSQLYKMHLDGQMEKPTELPPNLAKLTLWNSKSEQDAIATLEKLSHLRVLRLSGGSYCSKKMICSSGGFPLLELLELDCFHLEEWVAEEGAMPSLKSVLLFSADTLKTYPKRLHGILKRKSGNWFDE